MEGTLATLETRQHSEGETCVQASIPAPCPVFFVREKPQIFLKSAVEKYLRCGDPSKTRCLASSHCYSNFQINFFGAFFIICSNSPALFHSSEPGHIFYFT